MNRDAWADHAMVDAARALRPTVQALSPRIENERRLPQELVDELTTAQVFQMYLPASDGGPEVHPLTGFAVCEELARADGSVGWCAQVAAAVTIFLPWIDPEGLSEMVAISDGPLHLAGSARPLGTAVRTDDGYRIKGHWNFASGVAHANWFLATAIVENGGDDDGPPVARSMLLPVSDGQILANWDVVGMRGTGSDDFILDDVAVPRRRVGAKHWIDRRQEPLYSPKLDMVATWAPTAGVASGLARGAIDALMEVGARSSTGSPRPLRERAGVQHAVAEAEAIAGAARAYCIETIETAWRAVIDERHDEIGPAVARAQLAITHIMNEAVRVADLCFHAGGTNAISSENRLERSLRDTHTAVQHAAGNAIHKRVAGRTLLGLEPPPGPSNREGPNTPRV